MILRKNEIRIVAKKFIPVGLSFQLSPLPSYRTILSCGFAILKRINFTIVINIKGLILH